MAGLWLQAVPGTQGWESWHFPPQLPALCSLAVSTSNFCPLKQVALFHGIYFTSQVGLSACSSIHPFSRDAVLMERKDCGYWMHPWRDGHEHLDCSPEQDERLLSSQRKHSRQVHGLVQILSCEVGKRKIKPMELHGLLRKLSEQFWKVTWWQESMLARKEESSVSNETKISSSSSVKADWNFDGWVCLTLGCDQ